MIAIRTIGLAAMLVVGATGMADAQSGNQGAATDGEWHVSAYPILAWVPLDFGIDVDIPPSGGDGGGAGDIVDGRFDGAFFGGATAFNGTWLIEGYGIWAAFGGDRIERPFLVVDVDLIYGDVKVGRRIAREVYLTGGVRRVALKYDITLGNLPRLSRKPGVWDPLVGIGWHRAGEKIDWHASFEGGGFGVGADVDLGGTFRVDWKPVRHFGFTAGYSFLYLKVSDDVAGRSLTITPTMHGPTVGIGLYF
jgi:hypothetical protein